MKTVTITTDDATALLLAMSSRQLADEIAVTAVGEKLPVPGFNNALVITSQETRDRIVKQLYSVYHQVIDPAIIDLYLGDTDDVQP